MYNVFSWLCFICSCLSFDMYCALCTKLIIIFNIGKRIDNNYKILCLIVLPCLYFYDKSAKLSSLIQDIDIIRPDIGYWDYPAGHRLLRLSGWILDIETIRLDTGYWDYPDGYWILRLTGWIQHFETIRMDTGYWD